MTRMTARSLIFLPSILLPALAFAQQTPQSLADAELPSLLAIYKDVHAHPELSMHEDRSAAIVAKELKAAGYQVTERVGKYDKASVTCFGVVGVMKNGAGPIVLVRTDLDALPVHEETGLPYASTVTTKNDEGKEVPVMHACGHDTHIAAFNGTARLFSLRNRPRKPETARAHCSRADFTIDSANRISRSDSTTKPTCKLATLVSPKVTRLQMLIQSM